MGENTLFSLLALVSWFLAAALLVAGAWSGRPYLWLGYGNGAPKTGDGTDRIVEEAPDLTAEKRKALKIKLMSGIPAVLFVVLGYCFWRLTPA